jgi:hypothetical protein
MFRTPVAARIKAHVHDMAETHVVLVGEIHVFKCGGGWAVNWVHGGPLWKVWINFRPRRPSIRVPDMV